MSASQNDFISQCNDVINRLEQMRNLLPALITTQAHDSSALDGRLSGAIGQIESVRDKVTSLTAISATGSTSTGKAAGSAADDFR